MFVISAKMVRRSVSTAEQRLHSQTGVRLPVMRFVHQPVKKCPTATVTSASICGQELAAKLAVTRCFYQRRLAIRSLALASMAPFETARLASAPGFHFPIIPPRILP